MFKESDVFFTKQLLRFHLDSMNNAYIEEYPLSLSLRDTILA